MKLLRIAGFALLAAALILGIAASYLMSHEDEAVRYVLDQVRSRTGLEIGFTNAHFHFRSHLALDLENPEVIRGGHEVVQVSSARALISYHSILFTHGMPLYSLTLNRPKITVPQGEGEIAAAPLPRPGEDAVQAVLLSLNTLGKIAWRIQMTDASVSEPNGTPIVEHLNLLAYHRHFDARAWTANFDLQAAAHPLAGARIAGSMHAGFGRKSPPHQIASGQLWFWNADLAPVTAGAPIQAAGRMVGDLKFKLNDAGVASGSADVGVTQVALSGSDLKGRSSLGDYSLSFGFDASPQKLAMTDITLRHGRDQILAGQSAIDDPYGDKPRLTVHLKDIAIAAETLTERLAAVRSVPAAVLSVLGRVKSGRLRFTTVNYSGMMAALRTEPLTDLRRHLRFAARLSNTSFTLPAGLRLPDVSGASVALRYSNNVISAAQGSAALGGSTLSGIAIRLDLTKAPDRIPYGLSLNADCDLAGLFPALMHALDAIGMHARKRVNSLSGRMKIAMTASGTLSGAIAQPPSTYRVSLQPNQSVVSFRDTPGPITLAGGSVAVQPGEISIDKLQVAATGGDSSVSGKISFGGRGFRINNLTVAMHQMPAGQWLAMVVKPSNLAIQGALGGTVSVSFDSRNPASFRGNGMLTLNRGSVQFGFMRDPILTQGATFTLAGTRFVAAMPSSTLMGSPLDFKLTVPDLRHPSARIDAVVQRMNLEEMKFIRMPWEAPTPPSHVPFPITGHLVITRGNLSAFAMTDMRGDFSYQSGNWRVWNMTANAYQSKINLELSGREKDDWIHMKGKVAHIDVGPLFLLSGKRKEAPVTGTGWVAADLWADTDGDFFQTMAGSVAVTLRSGSLNRMTILSRLLGMIDIKSWITAKFPNPLESGLPFDTVFADLKGNSGDFFTDGAILQGPVMDITASGDVDFGRDNLDLRVGVFPFTTVSWLVSNIPLIGGHVSGGTKNLLAGYFHVTGPAGDPSVIPMPITSVTEFVKKTLGLPINLIRPNTIQ